MSEQEKKLIPVHLVSLEFTPIRRVDKTRSSVSGASFSPEFSFVVSRVKRKKRRDPLQKKKFCVVRAISGLVDSCMQFYFLFSVIRVLVTPSSSSLSLSRNMYSWHFIFSCKVALPECLSSPPFRLWNTPCFSYTSFVLQVFFRIWNQYFCPWQCCRCSLVFPYSLRCTK